MALGAKHQRTTHCVNAALLLLTDFAAVILHEAQEASAMMIFCSMYLFYIIVNSLFGTQ